MRAASLKDFLEDLRVNGIKFDDGTEAHLTEYMVGTEFPHLPVYTMDGQTHYVGSGPRTSSAHLTLVASGSTRCKAAKRYRAFFKPRCIGGKGCDACWAKWDAKHAPKPLKKLPGTDPAKDKFYDEDYYDEYD